MKSLEKLLSELHKANIRLWADGDHLRYSAPKGSLTPEIRDQLRERKPELLVFLNKIRPSQDNVFTPVSREGRDMSLSFAQQRMWFLYQLDPEDRSYNLVWPLRLRGNLRISALEQSIQAVIQRHEALRTTFRVKEGEPVQVISASATVTLPIDDLCDLPEAEQKATVQRLAIEGLQEPFDLENGPLLKYRLLPTSSGERVLLIFGHHIICDSWSAGIFIRDLGAFYRAYSEKKEPSESLLPKLPIQYADFAYRQREWLKGAELEKQIGFWKRQLDGAPFVLEIPADHPRPAELSAEGRLERFEIDSELTRRLNRLSQEYGATSFMTLFAAFSTLIFRYTGQEDILIGTLIANRNRKEIEHLIGVFVNTLVLRADLSGDPEFSDLVDRVRQVTLDAYGHQDIPFEQLIEVLQPPRRLSHTPLFQVMFSMQNAPLKMELPGLTMELLDVERETAQFDLSFDMTEIDGRLTGTVEYRTDLFEASAIRRMIGHFRTLLEAIAEEPMQRISELPLLTEPERHQLLAEWNDTHSEYPADKTVVDMFEEQAKKSPENIAVVFEDIRLTYRELNDRSNQIAHFITDEYQIRPDDRVGLLLERSEWVIIGIMGILKAGGAYVPIDPGYPEERIKHMVSDSGCKAVLSETGIVKIPGLQAELIDIRGIRHENYDNPGCPASPDNLAYVIYTSGSTGIPKGVMTEHRSVVNLICGDWQALYGRFGEGMHQALTASFVFDVSVAQIFISLIFGNTLYVITDETLHNPELFINFLQKKNIHIIDVSPGFLLSVVESKAAGKFPENIRHINLGAEKLAPSLIEKFYEYDEYQNITLCNFYGPTENCADSLWFPIDSGFQPFHTVPIGKPLPNIQVFILDAFLNPVPVGIPGEICLSGAGLARGYLNRPDLTAEKFVNWNPGTGNLQSEIRMYRTGDLGRWLADGNIEFLGRNDDQVKIRGYRVELGEIENHLLSHKSVSGTSVIAKEFRKDYTELAAYMTGDENLNVGELRNHLRTTLPDYMIPSYFIQLDKLPLTTGGKVDRRRLPEPETSRPQLETAYVTPETDTEQSIAGVWQELLKLEKVGIHDNFFDMGGHSLLIIRVQNKLQQIFSRDIPAVDLFRYPTISALARYLEQEQPAFHQVYDRSETREAVKTSRERRRASNSPEYFKESGIAVIGMSGRFPGADNIDEFWQNIKNGKESVSFFSDEELIDSGVEPSLLNSPNYVKAKGVLSDIDLFDALFFGFNPREAEIMGVQHRIFLECAWKALEDAGCNPDNYNGLIGVYAGAGMNTYLINNLCQNIGKLTPSEIYQAVISNDKDSLPTLASYKLNLKGPSIGIQTACSTSLVAVHMACQSLLNSECDMALAGGISVDVPHKTGYLYEQGMILSPDGHCRAFDANACGTVSGNGCGIVVLKRFEDALADRDCIYAVIRGSAVNNDGSMKVGFTAPSVDGQAGVIAEAIAVAGIDPDTITYIEAHGTGTIMGDPIEIAALTQVFHTEKADKKKYCAIGSVKTNIGHLDTAAGVTGLIKTVLALKNKVIPPSLNFEKPNSKIDFANSPFHVNTNLSEWKTHGTPRRAGVSSFGIGGTNAHVVLEEFGNLKLETGNWKLEDQHLLVLSAKTGSALDAATDNLAEHLKQNPDLNLADAAYTLQVGRKAFNHRRIVVCRDIAEAEKNLRTLDPKRVFSKFNEQEKQHVVFMFPGQGSQYVNMGLGLYQNEPVFRRQIDLCSEILKPFLKTDLRCLLYPAGDETEDAAQKLKQTAVAQAAVFTVEYALAVLWMEWGIRPGAMIGHSIGEYAAACLANVFSMEDALWLVAERGQMMQQIPGGSMLAVSLPEKEISIILENSGKEVSLSAVNGPSLCVVSGRKEAVEILQVQLEKQDIQCRLLHTSHAFHSEMMEPVTEAFAEKISQVTLKPPQIPFISDVTGTWITQEQSTDPDYWIRHLRQTVRFADGLGRLLEEPDRILLEVGPGRTLSTFATGRPDRKPGQTVLTSMRHPKDSHSDAEFILTTLGRLWLAGVRPDWAGFYAHEKRQRVHLPTYPFERKRYWIEPGDRPQQVLEIAEESQKIVNARISKKPDIADWFYVPSWKCSPLPPFSNSQFQSSYTWLLFIDECGLGDQLSERLEQAGQNVITVRSGSEFGRLSDKAFMLNRKEGDDYESLISELMSNPGKIPEKIVHLWSVTRNNPETSFDSESDSGFYSLLFLAQAISGQNSAVPFHITVVSDNIHQVTGEESLCPGKATALGPVKVIPQEYSNIRFKHIDVVIPESEAEKEKKVTIPLLTEMIAETTDTTIAFRGNSRWVQIFEPVRLEAENKTETIPLRERGVYLITGGLGGIGLILAEYLAKTVKARLVLTGRSSLPPREEWDQWTAVHGEQNDISRKLFKIRDIEDLGAKALPLSADAADEEQMRKVIVQAENIFGPINGVIHAAGNTRENAFLLIKETGKTICEGHFQPKAHGLLILEKILREKKPDFCLLMSSLSSVLGGLGFAAYSAANIFMDTFVTSANSDTDKFRRWISVNWDGWNFGKEQELIGSIKHLAVTPQEGTEAFRRILSVCPGRQVIVSSGDLQARFDQWIRLGDSPDTDPVKTEISYERHTRPGLETPYTPPENDTERIIADRWQTILGIDKIGIHDNFFELGGNSLVAVQLISWINETFWTELTLDTIFNTTTVAELAGSIESIHDSLEDDSEKIARKLEFVEGLSEDEVKIFLQDLKE